MALCTRSTRGQENNFEKPAQSAFISYLVEVKCQRLECGTESTEAALEHVDLLNFLLKAPLLQMTEEMNDWLEKNENKQKKKQQDSKTREWLSYLMISPVEVMIEAPSWVIQVICKNYLLLLLLIEGLMGHLPSLLKGWFWPHQHRAAHPPEPGVYGLEHFSSSACCNEA